jgi:hypothetical protein
MTEWCEGHMGIRRYQPLRTPLKQPSTTSPIAASAISAANRQRLVAPRELTSVNRRSYTVVIPPVRFGGWDAGPPSGGPCAFRTGFYQPLGLWIEPVASFSVCGS